MLKKLLEKLSSIDLKIFVFIFPFIACLHELEEWDILPWHMKYNVNVPEGLVNSDLHIIFILISVLFFIWTVISLLPKNKKTTAYLFFPILVISFVNGMEHLIWTIRFRVYAPGFIFGFLFQMPLLLYITIRILKENLVNKWYSTMFIMLAISGTINLIMLGNELDPIIRNAMYLSKVLSDLIYK